MHIILNKDEFEIKTFKGSEWIQYYTTPISTEQAMDMFSQQPKDEDLLLFFWDNELEHLATKCTLLGYDYKVQRYIVRDWMGHLAYKDRCGLIHVKDSNYLFPIMLHDNLEWLIAKDYADLVKKNVLTMDLLPLYETSLNVQEFFKKVQNIIEQ